MQHDPVRARNVRARQFPVLAAGLVTALAAAAEPVNVTIPAAIASIGEYEYGTAQPLPPGTPSLLPLFAGAHQLEVTFAFESAGAVDLDPSSTRGVYLLPGQFTLRMPDIDVWVHAHGDVGVSVDAGQGITISSFAITSYNTSFGSAWPFAISATFYNHALANDSLPTTAFAWDVLNAYIDVNGVTPPRDIFILASPVPEPGAAWLMLGGGAVLALLRRRRLARRG
jgi:hypothetical protein